jgi:hypothetical protein
MADDAGVAEDAKRQYPGRWIALGVAFLAVALVVAGIWVYAAHQPPGVNLVKLQWRAGSAAVVMGEIRRHPVAAYRTAVNWDLIALVPGYAVGLLLACGLGTRVFWTPRFRGWAKVGTVAAVAAGVFNIAQDLLLRGALGNGLRGSWMFDAAEAMSLAKFSALLVAAAIAIMAIGTTSGRLVMHRVTRDRWNKAKGELPSEQESPLVIPPPPIEAAADARSRAPATAPCNQSWWHDLSAGSRTRWAQGFASPSDRPENSIGICVSGGGIRSASVALGALQALREKGVLGQADYLVSVSGGGYTAGGMQLAFTRARDGLPAGQAPVTKAAGGDAFDPGSAEEDHLRRHSSYIADGLGQWLVALAVLFRGVFSSLVVIGLTITTLGLAIGEFYRTVPIAAGGHLALLLPRFAVVGKHAPAPSYPAILLGVWVAIGGAAALALLAYLAQLIPAGVVLARWMSRMAKALLGAAALLAAIGVVLPALLWASSWVTWPLGLGPLRTGTVSSLSLIVTYLGAVVATFWRNRTTIAKTAGTVTGPGKKGPVNQVLPNSMIQLIIMWICLLFLILVALLLCGWVATSRLAGSWWALAPVGVLAVLVVVVDQGSLSLHPFYRRRLASAFAVRRAERDGADVAEPYRYDEMTPLSTYGLPREGFPAVTFAATANITGQDRTPPGRSAAPFMLAHDYLGGPVTGWVRTDLLQGIAGRHLSRDLTVEAAVAISGAAFASAMGSASRFYEVFLAISNARLGAWLPNPYFVARKLENPDNWTIPGLPDRRRLSYFAREIFGIHPSTSRLLLCTDGGHYDNLGLVELLRRRCKRIYCIDASGAAVPLDDTLAGAAMLAQEELGVDLSFTEQAFELVPGGREQLLPAGSFTDLNKRLSKSAVTIAGIMYPEVARRKTADDHRRSYQATSGEVVFAQAVLTPGMPYQLLDFPQDDAGFPHDSTGDQWFNAAQFDSYQQLGRFIGQEAARRPAAAVGDHPLPGHAPRSRPHRRFRMSRLRHPRR